MDPIVITPPANSDNIAVGELTAAFGIAGGAGTYNFSYDQQLATFDSNGLTFTGAAPGQFNFQAADPTFPTIVSNAVPITVYGPLAITVNDADRIILLGGTAQFTATGGLGNGVNWKVDAGKGSFSTEVAGKYQANEDLNDFSDPETVTVKATDKDDDTITATLDIKIANPSASGRILSPWPQTDDNH